MLSVIFNFENSHPSGNFKGKHPFKPQCCNVNENSDVDAAINHTSYQSEKLQEKKTTFKVFFVRSTLLVSPTGIYGTLLLPLTLLTTAIKKKNNIRGLFAFIRVELQALLISGPPSRMRKGRSCKAEILICA